MSYPGGLFPSERTCIACQRSALPGPKRRPDDPIILAVSMILYRRGKGKARLKAAPRVNICEECFVRAIAAPMDHGFELLAGITESLSGCYSAMIDREAFDQVKRHDWRNPEQAEML